MPESQANNGIRWKFIYPGGKEAHAFSGPAARTSFCKRANTISRGPWAFVPEGYDMPRCNKCETYANALLNMKVEDSKEGETNGR